MLRALSPRSFQVEMTTIQSLSDDVLLEVFKHLDGNSLKSAANVCRNWAYLIGSSSSTLNKLKLKMGGWRFECFVFQNKRLWLQHRNIDIDFGKTESNTTLRQFFDLVDVSQVKNLTLKNLAFFTEIAEFLAKMQNVEVMDLQFSRPLYDNDTESRLKVRLPKLAVLTVSDTGSGIWSMFRYLKATQLTELRLERSRYEAPVREVTELVNFLKNCRRLTKLSLPGYYLEDFVEARHGFWFQLTDFEVNRRCKIFISESDQHNEFLLSQASSLVTLNLSEVVGLGETMLETIFNEFKCLMVLKINSEFLYEITRESKLKPLLTLQELEIHEEFDEAQSVKIILENCPNLKKFKLGDSHSEVINHLTNFCPQLVDLSLLAVEDVLGDGLKFENLKSLKIEYIENADNWLSLVVNSPSIERFEADDEITEAAIDVLLEHPMLRHLSFKFPTDVSNARIIFNKLKNDHGHLDSLQLQYFDCDISELFNFSDEWNLKEAEERFERFHAHVRTEKM